MIIKRILKILCFLQLFVTFSGFATTYSQVNELRYFPNVNSKYLSNISQSSEGEFTVVGCDDILYYLEKTNFKEFYPKLPVEDVLFQYVKVFSRNNIWVFYTNAPKDYYTRCYHFYGNKWESISLPQSHWLQYFSFLDSNKFLAAGMWGSLIYHDGNKVENIKTIPYSYASSIQAFDRNNFLLSVKNEENENTHTLYYFHNDKYEILFQANSHILNLHFTDPKNGYIFLQNGKIYKSTNGNITLSDSIEISGSVIIDKSNAFYSNNFGVWKYDFKKKTRICDNSNFNFIYPINNQEYFLIKNNNRLFYYGTKNRGTGKAKNKTEFKTINYSYQATGDLGIGLYRNQDKNVQAYFTAWEEVNHFYEISKNKNIIHHPLDLKEKLVQSNLLGYGADRMMGDNDDTKLFFDVGMFFNDVDNDGDADVVMTSLRGGGKIYENEGNDKFIDVTDVYNFKLTGRTKNIFWNDLNNDGLIDLIIGPAAQPLHVLLNKGYWRFEDKTNTGIIPDSLIGFTPAFADVDNDGDRDLFLYSGYDHIHYFENQTEKKENAEIKFVDKSYISPQLTTKFDFFPFWLAFGDYDNDGDLDLFLANRVTPIKLFDNNGKGVFTDVGSNKIPNRSFLAYSANWGDFDQDGYQDLFLATVGKNYILWNHKAKYFELDSLCFQENQNGLSVGSVVNDIDNDGDLDIIFTNSEFVFSQILLNSINNKNSILFCFPFTNSTGTKVWLYENDEMKKQKFVGFREIELSQGYCSSGLPEVHFGVDTSKIYSAIIQYPSGYEQIIDSIIPGKIYNQSEPENNTKVIKQLKSNVESLFLNARKRVGFINIFILGITLLVLSFLSFKRYNWKVKYYLLFYPMVLLVYFMFAYVTTSLNNWQQIYFRVYGTIAGSIILFYLINKYSRLVYKDTHHFELFDLLRQFNHSTSGIKYIDHIIFLTNNPNLLDAKWRKKFIDEIRYFKNHSLPLLKRMNSLYSRLYYKNRFNKKMNFVKKLTNKTINKSSLLKNIIPKFQKGLLELKQAVKDVKNEIQKEYSTELIKNLTITVGQFSEKGKFTIYNNLKEKELKVLIREEDLAQVFNNVLQNAMESMYELEQKTLDIFIDRKDTAHIQVKIRDFGIGLPKLKMESWFDEHFSTKKSTGLGLYHSQKLLESFDGEIELQKPKSGSGTIAIITLRLQYNANGDSFTTTTP